MPPKNPPKKVTKRTAKPVHLSVSQKLELLRKIDGGMSVAQVCELYGVKKQTVSDIKKARGKLENYAVKFAVSGKGDATRKHMKDPKCVELDLAVYKWYTQERACGVEVRGVELAASAAKLAAHMGIEFKASDGWLWRFRRRHGIRNLAVTDEAESADAEMIEPFRDDPYIAKKIYLQDKKNKNSAEIGLQNHHGSHTPTQLSRPDSQQQGKGTQKPGRGSKSRKKPTTCQVLPLTNPFDSDAPSDCEMEEDAPPPNPPPAEQLAPTPEPPVCTPPETRPPSATLSTTSTAGSMLPPEVPASPAPPSLDGQEEALPSLDGEEEALLLLDGQEDAQPSLDGQEDLRPTSPEDVLSVPPSESSPPPQQPPKRKRSDNASVPEQRSEDVMDLKYKEHELDMEIKRTEQECAIMEKELKQLNLEMVKMDSEVKRVELKVLNLSLKNKEIQTQTFQNELQNSKKMSRVLDVWENTAVTVQTAASGIIDYLNHLKS
ncbi:arp2/3 complex-activating protein rickA-like isoform X1 [Eriocheir sinensis]|uniref:arp2/3 complex-activating protein rickA-like isoform X1 n=1 Tax=Eriocheir sinensis TaxID=95602 RepID=UPI0021C5D58B|nr:arp2/3 complex-activating protein rickA-like isoform X1 [Eriocheir sinensis]